MTRGFVGTTFYAPRGDQWVQLKLPEFYQQVLKISRAAGKKRVVVDENSPAKGHEGNLKWLPRGRFRLEAGYRAIGKMDMPFGGDWEQLFWITFRVVDASGKSRPRILLEKVDFAPGSVYPAKPRPANFGKHYRRREAEAQEIRRKAIPCGLIGTM